MIKPNELRIGNLVQNENNVCLSIGIKELYEVSEYAYLYQPIPLTEEWLLKLGFVYLKNERRNNEWHLSGFTYDAAFTDRRSLWFDLINKELVITSTPYDEMLVKCEHVHQLQNLYFALTGEELSMKEVKG